MMSGFIGGELGSATGRRHLSVPTLYPRWCELRDVLGNHNIHILISSPRCRWCIPSTLKKNSGENITAFINPKMD